MANPAQTAVLSTPGIYIDGDLWAIVPNSFKDKNGGELNVRAMSGGAGVIEVVAGYDASKELAEFSFEVAHTAENRERVARLEQNRRNGISSTARAVTSIKQVAWDTMWLSNEVEKEWKADGNMKLEFKGRVVF